MPDTSTIERAERDLRYKRGHPRVSSRCRGWRATSDTVRSYVTDPVYADYPLDHTR